MLPTWALLTLLLAPMILLEAGSLPCLPAAVQDQVRWLFTQVLFALDYCHRVVRAPRAAPADLACAGRHSRGTCAWKIVRAGTTFSQGGICTVAKRCCLLTAAGCGQPGHQAGEPAHKGIGAAANHQARRSGRPAARTAFCQCALRQDLRLVGATGPNPTPMRMCMCICFCGCEAALGAHAASSCFCFQTLGCPPGLRAQAPPAVATCAGPRCTSHLSCLKPSGASPTMRR